MDFNNRKSGRTQLKVSNYYGNLFTPTSGALGDEGAEWTAAIEERVEGGIVRNGARGPVASAQ